MRPLISTDELARRLGEPHLRVIDARWYLDPTRRASDAYAAGHIPGAVFIDLESGLSAPGGGRGLPAGRHPWPSPEQVARVMGAAGVTDGVTVVAYDDAAGAVAARLWFVLRAHGHADVAVLDGGLVKWLAEGRALDTTAPSVAPSAFVPRLRADLLVDKRFMRALAPGQELVLDARFGERYRGEVEPIDPRAGHIPGARNAPFSANLTPGPVPVFRAPDELREHYAALGAHEREPIVYCGSGVNACHDLLALDLCGLRGRLYAGSWSEWSCDPALPAATGAEDA